MAANALNQITAPAKAVGEKDPQLPQLTVASLEFSDGQTIGFNDNDIVVITGPNNSGKTVALGEIYAFYTSGDPDCGSKHRVLKQMTRRMIQTPDALKISIRHHCQVVKGHVEYMPTGPYNVSLDQIVQMPLSKGIPHPTGTVAPIFIAFLQLERRLQMAADSGLPPPYPAPVTALNHYLYRSRGKEFSVSEAFKTAFQMDFVVNRCAGESMQLRCGVRPAKGEEEEEYDQSFQTKMLALEHVGSQGHGVKAFAGILMQVLANPTSVLLIDEPEAFLHPPQAYLLGRWLSFNKSKETQIFVSTHSSDFIRGLLDANEERVRLLRLTHVDKINPVKELKSGDVKALWTDPILRYSNAIDGLFHTKVVVCEADSDCRFYSALMDAVRADGDAQACLFLPTFTKDRLAVPVEALQPVGVHTVVVADIDILKPDCIKTLTRIVSALGGNIHDFEADLNIIAHNVDPKGNGHESSAEIAFKTMEGIICAARQSGAVALSENVREGIKLAIKEKSPWENVKRTGKAWFKGDAAAGFSRIDAALRKLGLFIVPVGIMEGFAPHVGGHGPKWLLATMKLDLKAAPELFEAREFATAVLRH